MSDFLNEIMRLSHRYPCLVLFYLVALGLPNQAFPVVLLSYRSECTYLPHEWVSQWSESALCCTCHSSLRPATWRLDNLETHYNDVIMSAKASQIISVSIVYSTVCSCADKRKHQSSVSLAFVRGIRRSPVNSPHKRPVTREMFPFDDVIIQPPSVDRLKPWAMKTSWPWWHGIPHCGPYTMVARTCMCRPKWVHFSSTGIHYGEFYKPSKYQKFFLSDASLIRDFINRYPNGS